MAAPGKPGAALNLLTILITLCGWDGNRGQGEVLCVAGRGEHMMRDYMKVLFCRMSASTAFIFGYRLAQRI